MDSPQAAEPARGHSARGWLGLGGEHRLVPRWSVGLDVELIRLHWGQSASSGSIQGFPYESSGHDSSLSLLSGAHVWLARYARADSTDAAGS